MRGITTHIQLLTLTESCRLCHVPAEKQQHPPVFPEALKLRADLQYDPYSATYEAADAMPESIYRQSLIDRGWKLFPVGDDLVAICPRCAAIAKEAL